MLANCVRFTPHRFAISSKVQGWSSDSATRERNAFTFSTVGDNHCGSPCARFCPAKVYEETVDKDGSFETIQVNFSNCLHCKTCEIKDPQQNIQWNLPDGGDGPRWQKM